MTLVTIYVKIIFHDHVSTFIMRIMVLVFHPYNVDKNGDLVAMPMHGLHFILDLIIIGFCKIYHKNFSIIYKILKAKLEHCILPSCHKNMVGKELKFQLQVLNQLTRNNRLIKKLEFFPFFSSSNDDIFHRKMFPLDHSR